MGLAVLMLQCLLAALAEVRKKNKNEKTDTTGKTGKNAPIATLAEREIGGGARTSEVPRGRMVGLPCSECQVQSSVSLSVGVDVA